MSQDTGDQTLLQTIMVMVLLTPLYYQLLKTELFLGWESCSKVKKHRDNLVRRIEKVDVVRQ